MRHVAGPDAVLCDNFDVRVQLSKGPSFYLHACPLPRAARPQIPLLRDTAVTYLTLTMEVAAPDALQSLCLSM